MSNWIPVSERLPEYDVEVLATDRTKHIYKVYLDEESRRFLVAHNDNVATVTHWMPLPEPPND